jgi:hypothetical protein
VTIPKSFTGYRISYTWKKGTVLLRSATYVYTYKQLR